MSSKPDITRIRDAEAGLEGWVVVDAVVRGESSGGLRMTPTVDEAELCLLARTMTLKYGFLGFPKGGAKAGIRFDGEKDPEKARALLGLFGRRARALLETRRFSPGPDMGTNEEGIRYLLRESGTLDRRMELWRWANSGRFTAAGLVGAFHAAAERSRIPEDRRTVSIEGLGAVGLSAARSLAACGVRIVAVANRHGRIRLPEGLDPELWSAFVGSAGAARIADFPGCEPITQEEFLALPVTGFLPCALAHTVTHRNAELLGARIVVPGANNPLTPEARILLERRGVLVLPDFVTNAGGVMGGALEFGGLRPALVDDLVCDVLADAVRRLLDRSEALGSPPIDLAEKTALARFERMKSASSSRIALGALSLRREKRIPKWISAPLAELYVRQLRRRLARYE